MRREARAPARMLLCSNCGTKNPSSSQFCDECGAKLGKAQDPRNSLADYVPPSKAPFTVSREIRKVESLDQPRSNGISQTGAMNAALVIERGGNQGTEFKLTGTEAIVGRWDADNGVFPEVDLDIHDGEAKVSRRHARIKLLEGQYVVEDLGSTNGTYINRGRRLLPGMPQPISDGDELIVGKTFLRFRVKSD